MRFGSVPRRQHVDTRAHTRSYKSCREREEEEEEEEEEEVRLDNEFEMRHRLIEYGMSMKLDLCRWRRSMAQLNYSAIFSRVKPSVLSPFVDARVAEIHGSNVPWRKHGEGRSFISLEFEFLRISDGMIDAYDCADDNGTI